MSEEQGTDGYVTIKADDLRKLTFSFDGRKRLEALIASSYQWQPIESAPRDGTEILILFDDERIKIVSWQSHEDSSYPFLWKTQDGRCAFRPWKGEEGPTHFAPLLKPVARALSPLEEAGLSLVDLKRGQYTEHHKLSDDGDKS